MLDLRWLNIILINNFYINKLEMFSSRFILVSLFFGLSGAVTDNARDLQRILNTQSISHFRYFFNRNNAAFLAGNFRYQIPIGTETLKAETGYTVRGGNPTPVLTVYRYYRVPASDGNRYKVYVETNARGMHWIVEVDPYLLGLWEGETGPRKPGDNSEVEFRALQSLVG